MDRALSALIALLALASLVAQGAVVARLTGPRPLLVLGTMLAFFTIWAAVAALAVHGAAALRPRPLGAGWQGAVLAWTLLVGVAFHILLARGAGAAGSPFATGLGWWSTQGLHTALPLLVALHWAAFAPKELSVQHALLWLLLPLLYLALALGAIAATGGAPYPFLDPGRIGWAGVAASVAGLVVAVLLLHAGILGTALALTRGQAPPAASAPSGPPPR